MYEIDQSDLPTIRTARALLILDAQNDFLAAGAQLPVTRPPGYLDNIRQLVPSFRQSHSYIVWVQSCYESSRVVNTSALEAEHVVIDPDTSEDVSTKNKTDESFEADETDHTGLQEAFLTDHYRSLSSSLLATSPGKDLFEDVADFDEHRTTDIVIQKTTYSAFRDGSLVRALRGRFVTEIYICGVLTNISVYATAMEAPQHGYGITIVRDCLGYRSEARHDTALRRLVQLTGCDLQESQAVMSELQSLRQPKVRRAKSPSRQPSKDTGKARTEFAGEIEENVQAWVDVQRRQATGGAYLALSPSSTKAVTDPGDQTVQDEAQTEPAPHAPRQANRIKLRRRSFIKGQAAMDVDLTASMTRVSIGEAARPSEGTGHASNVAVLQKTASSEPPHVPSMSSPADNIHAVDDAATDLAIRATTNRVRPTWSAPLCEGDTHVMHDFLPEPDIDGLFEDVRDEVHWQRMSHQGGEVPRLVSCQSDRIGSNVLVYRHPSDESLPSTSFTTKVAMIRKHVEAHLGHDVNHVLIQLYRDGTDYISEHSDKTLDIVPNTFIANVSLGAQRTMLFRTKRTKDLSGEAAPTARDTQRAILPHNSLFKVGLKTNIRWLHSIRQDKRLAHEKSDAELAFDGARISLTFRKIGTYLDTARHTIWGQGATSKDEPGAKTVVNGDAAQSQKLLRAFGAENQSSDFDWHAVYGLGSDVLHISNRTKLYLSHDPTANLKVKLMLAHHSIDWTEGTLSAPFRWRDLDPKLNAAKSSTSANAPITFIDNDPARTNVTGDIAIMLYIDATRGPAGRSPHGSRDPADLARLYTRFQQANELLPMWRAEKPSITQAMHRASTAWTTYAQESDYMAGGRISLVDFAFIPAAMEIGSDEAACEGVLHKEEGPLRAYWRRVMQHETVVKVLGPPKSDVEESGTGARNGREEHARDN